MKLFKLFKRKPVPVPAPVKPDCLIVELGRSYFVEFTGGHNGSVWWKRRGYAVIENCVETKNASHIRQFRQYLKVS
jgi:hypothetical protein